MSNLLRETIETMTAAGLTPDDVVFIGSEASGHVCTWAEFQTLADVDYDAGYGSAQVAPDLEIRFRDGSFMERGEYDGEEWWEMRRPFVEPTETHPIARLFVTDGGYESSLLDIDRAVREAEVADLPPVTPRCRHVSPSPWGATQCALPLNHDEAEGHAYSPSEAIEDAAEVSR